MLFRSVEDALAVNGGITGEANRWSSDLCGVGGAEGALQLGFLRRGEVEGEEGRCDDEVMGEVSLRTHLRFLRGRPGTGLDVTSDSCGQELAEFLVHSSLEPRNERRTSPLDSALSFANSSSSHRTRFLFFPPFTFPA